MIIKIKAAKILKKYTLNNSNGPNLSSITKKRENLNFKSNTNIG